MSSWSCVENCGACCKFDIKNRLDLENKLSIDDFNLIEKMTGKDGWCVNFDKTDKKCKIYETRPHFCRVSEFSKAFKEYFKFGDKFLIECCKQHISSNYGNKSEQMKHFKMSVKKR